MKWPKQDEIPQTVIKPGDAIITDFSSLNGKGSLMHYNLKCVVIGLDDVPHILTVTAAFQLEDIPAEIGANIYGIEKLIFQSTFELPSKKNPHPKQVYPIPSWVSHFKKVKHICFNYANLDNLAFIKALPIEELVLKEVHCNDIPKAIEAINSMKSLREVSYDQDTPIDLINALKKLPLKLNVVD